VNGIIKNEKGEVLSFVNIGIKSKNVGTCSSAEGTFSIQIPKGLEKDSLSFHLMGYDEIMIPISQLATAQSTNIILKSISLDLNPITVTSKKPVEKKFGITKYKPVMHFTDGSIQQNDIFEIAQVIHLPEYPAKITSLNLFIYEARKDSAVFRLNFYEILDGKPAHKLNVKEILQKKAIEPGWLSFDIKNESLYLKDDVAVGIEFVPSGKGSIRYEVKVGGTTKSFVRTSSLGEWQIPPHHYRIYATALVSSETKRNPHEDEELESTPSKVIYSNYTNDSAYIFVSVPKDYNKKSKTLYPTVYLLDANVYFDFLKGNTENIIVGIGYKNAFLADSLRQRDYTYPAAAEGDSLTVSGGGLNYLKSIEKELIPYIEEHYPADPTRRTLMGHSLGGYFTLFALGYRWKDSAMFNTYIAASPSLNLSQNYLIEQFKHLKGHPAKPASLLITAGSEENLDELPILNDLLKGTSIKTQCIIFPKVDHMETAVRTFKTALSSQSSR
jgi:predicted alpha/beta superfamily hydrolase